MVLFGVSDKGTVRRENEDSFRIEKLGARRALAVLCDGMGGAQAGDVASRIAAEAFVFHTSACLNCAPEDDRDLFDVISEAADYANLCVYDRAFSDFGCMGMGTTLVGALVRDGECLVVNVGDSRGYRIDEQGIVQLTRDHSLVEELIRSGRLTREEAKDHPRRNVIMRALGVEQTVRSDVFSAEVTPGAILLLCSDGLSNVVSDTEIYEQARAAAGPEALCRSLLKTALDAGASDNVTVVAVKF